MRDMGQVGHGACHLENSVHEFIAETSAGEMWGKTVHKSQWQRIISTSPVARNQLGAGEQSSAFTAYFHGCL
jgi:hypothetical protein